MATTATFSVDPRLATVLGETYKSTERAIKELIDNAWDADADHVWIDLPAAMSSSPVVVKDDGTGMTEDELRTEYLSVARDRRSHRGDLTSKYRRSVKGRRGIGKFAGLMVAETMTVTTQARGRQTTLLIPRKKLLQARADFEKVHSQWQCRTAIRLSTELKSSCQT
jgi:HSP90 family molecular chaperone